MAFCTACGGEVMDTAVVCVKCGSAIKSKTDSGTPWATGTIVALCIATLVIPLIGFFAGGWGVVKEAKRSQGFMLLGLACLTTIFWIAIN